LKIGQSDIDILGNVKINTLKKGQSRSVSSGELRTFFLECRQNSVYPFQGISRNYVYRCYVKCGLQFVTGIGRNNIVTHLFRHATAAAIRNEGFEATIISLKLAHKSKNTEKHYGKDFTEKEESA
jgi:integrase